LVGALNKNLGARTKSSRGKNHNSWVSAQALGRQIKEYLLTPSRQESNPGVIRFQSSNPVPDTTAFFPELGMRSSHSY